MKNEEHSTDSKCNEDNEVSVKREGRLITDYIFPELKYPFGRSLIVPLHLEFERLARERLHKEGIYPTKNNTILRVIK